MSQGKLDRWIAGVGGSVCVVLTAVVLMGQTSAPMAEKMASASATIAAINAKQKALTLQTDFAMHEFAVESDTKISDGQKTMKLDQLTPGTEVTVEYAQVGEKLVARFITLDAAGKSASAAPVGADRMARGAQSAAAPASGPTPPTGIMPEAAAPRAGSAKVNAPGGTSAPGAMPNVRGPAAAPAASPSAAPAAQSAAPAASSAPSAGASAPAQGQAAGSAAPGSGQHPDIKY